MATPSATSVLRHKRKIGSMSAGGNRVVAAAKSARRFALYVSLGWKADASVVTNSRQPYRGLEKRISVPPLLERTHRLRECVLRLGSFKREVMLPAEFER